MCRRRRPTCVCACAKWCPRDEVLEFDRLRNESIGSHTHKSLADRYDWICHENVTYCKYAVQTRWTRRRRARFFFLQFARFWFLSYEMEDGHRLHGGWSWFSCLILIIHTANTLVSSYKRECIERVNPTQHTCCKIIRAAGGGRRARSVQRAAVFLWWTMLMVCMYIYVEGVWMICVCVFVMYNVRQINNDDDAAVIYIKQAARMLSDENENNSFS